jgi:hypothetical protein
LQYKSYFVNLNKDSKETIITNLSDFYTSIKVPHSFARNTRDFQSVLHWKANEYKVFIMYTGVPALMSVLKMSYFEHFCLYSLIIRKLCDTNFDIYQKLRIQKLFIFLSKSCDDTVWQL